MSSASPELDGFNGPVPYTRDAVRSAPTGRGVHVVLSQEGVTVFVGRSKNLRERLLEHLAGDRQASVLHDQVGQRLDRQGRIADRREIEAYLNTCTVAWRESDDPEDLKNRLVAELQPIFNRQRVQAASGVWWVNQGQSYDSERAHGILFAAEGPRALAHHSNVRRLRPGDTTLHHRRGLLVALGTVVADAGRQPRPSGESTAAGWLASVEYFDLAEPLRLADLPMREGTEGPFDRNGSVKQGYLFALEPGWAEQLRDQHRDRWPAGSAWSSGKRRYWLLQADPERWELEAHLPDTPPGHVADWTVTPQRPEMQSGDGVALGQGGAGGVMAVGRLAGVARLLPRPGVRSESAGQPEFRVGVEIHRHLDPPITRGEVLADPLLSQMAVIKQPSGGTNFPLTLAEWRAILGWRTLGASVDALGDLVAEFQRSLPYDQKVRAKREGERQELAQALTEDALGEPDRALLRRLAGPAYGSPGPQPGFNTYLQDDATLGQIVERLQYLLYGEGGDADRLASCIEGPHKLPKVGEAMLTKALAVQNPSRWVPCYVTNGKNGKREILPLIGADPAVVDVPHVGQAAVAGNDAIRATLEPYLPGDPWGMQEFTWWLLHRVHVPEVPGGLAALAGELYLPEEFLARCLRLLDDKGQVVFYGPPGTGKTYVARELAGHLARGGGSVEKVQFHPSYAYEDFVEGYRPRTRHGQMTYQLVDGPLKRIAVKARERPDVSHVLLIDEVNRANVAKVLGEMLFLLEYRDEDIHLQYSEDEFALPPNLKIIATMNTADRSIALVDAALRRRFHFVGFFPDTEPIAGLLPRWLEANYPRFGWLAHVLEEANKKIGDRAMAIGPSHFMKAGLTEEKINMAWESSVIPFVEELFFGDPDRVAELALDRLRSGIEPAPPASVILGAPDE